MQRHKDKILFGLLISTLLLTGCITEFHALLPENDTRVLFVDGSIIENTDVIFHITQGFSIDVNVPPKESFINDATLTIIGSNGYKSSPAINQGKGAYLISVGELDDDVEYGIQIELDGESYQSTLSRPLYTAEIESVSWEQPKKYGPVFFRVSTYDSTEGPHFFAWGYIEDWEVVANVETKIFFEPEYNNFTFVDPAPFFYCWKKNEPHECTFGSTESLRENRIINKLFYQCDNSSGDRFVTLYSLTVNQRAISRGAYEYYQNIKKMNEDMGGLFTPQPMEFVGNISCITNPKKKILGYVDVNKNTTHKRIFIYSSEVVWEWPYPSSPECRQPTIVLSDLVNYWYQMGLRPSYNKESWYPVECTDCTANGGTKDKPDFWPNDHR